jgi:Cytochrome c554 and c-prime
MRLALGVRRAPFVILTFATIGVGPSTSGTDAAPVEAPYGSAKACASCHKTIYTYWSESIHAQAVSRESYRDALGAAMAGATDKEGVRRGCVWCHAPTTLTTGDYELRQPISKEAITCDFCHTVTDVDLDKADHPFQLKPGNRKLGPLQYVKSPSHETEYSPLHKASPLLCAACHEHRNAQGVPVLSTYSEWKDSPYPARGMLCQECHMPLVPGDTVREGLGSSQRMINLHRMVGGSGYAQIRRGLDLRIESLTRSSVSADVQVVVTNSGVGHAAPGGLSTKAIVLAVGVETASGELLHRRERVYRRDLLDAEGRTLATVPDLFLRATSVGNDTRLKPKESRAERFTVPIPEGSKAIVVRLEYRDASDPKAGPKTTLVTEERRELTAR